MLKRLLLSYVMDQIAPSSNREPLKFQWTFLSMILLGTLTVFSIIIVESCLVSIGFRHLNEAWGYSENISSLIIAGAFLAQALIGSLIIICKIKKLSAPKKEEPNEIQKIADAFLRGFNKN